jgi:hypothetical protein
MLAMVRGRRAVFRALLLLGVSGVSAVPAACARSDHGSIASDPPLLGAPDGCAGLACQRALCTGARSTRVTGRVTDPAGLRGLYDVAVYVPSTLPSPVLHGARCDLCASRQLVPVVSALTDARGEFVLDDVPVGKDIPIVVEIGRWRRVTSLDVEPCVETRAADDAVRLPRRAAEGDLPRIAVTTGASDALECLLRSIGIADEEVVPGDADPGSVHLFRGKGGGGIEGQPVIPDAADLWNDPARLARYDIVALSCEGSEADENKGGTDPEARSAMHAYANAGGHVFATHFQYTWLKSSPAQDFRDIATWSGDKDVGDEYAIDTSFPKGQALADWLVATGASATAGAIHLDDVTSSLGQARTPPAQVWIRKTAGAARYFSFNTPVGALRADRCGRVVFGDLHGFGLGGSDYPAGCPADPKAMSPQQLALEFLLFDLFACVDDDRERPVPPR